jgi:glycopeptide antibiotics resistance protein
MVARHGACPRAPADLWRHLDVTATSTRRQGTSILTVVLFAVYAVLLVCLVLFKFPFRYQLDSSGRDLNLIPFAGAFADSRLGIGEVVDNVLVFLPLGLYLSMLRTRWSTVRRILAVVGTSVAFEVIQYVFGIGRSDITDVITNTLGGAIGIGIYAVTRRMLGIRTNRVLTVVELIATVVILLFVGFLALHSR